MTIDNMKEAIKNYCRKFDSCTSCKLHDFVGSGNCYSGNDFAQIEKNYAYLFGNEAVKPDEITSEVDHPDHYKGDKYECIEVMQEVFGADAVKDFCLCNAFKYLWRCKKKHDNAVTDIKKAKFYLEKYIELVEGEAKMNGE